MVQTNNPRVSTKPNPKGYGDVGLKNLPPLTLPTAKKEGLGDDDSSSRLMNWLRTWGIGLAITATGQNNSSANGNSGGGGADKNSRYGEQDIMTAGENELAKQLVATYFEWLETHVGKESAIAKQEKMVVYSNTNNAGDNENSQIAWSSSQPWPNMLPECPKVLIGIIQSLACRGAIKFGDVLDRQQCSKLVDDLKKCLYPQYCAHGRTSVASLFQMSIMPDSSEDAGTDPAVVGSELSIVDSTDSQNKNNQDAFRRKYKRFRKRHCDYHHHLHN
ncbi:DNA mismatch repair protein [Mycoemilia scoparia]|uniref:DNA mismatch repair protein n=1 Tax=Mycoemilia scoparia TaxID=417184 RepID=A0A9W8DRM5_9FUNG|nr:DNA mismatch repair protein [Mycoemilia scoparia]